MRLGVSFGTTNCPSFFSVAKAGGKSVADARKESFVPDDDEAIARILDANALRRRQGTARLVDHVIDDDLDVMRTRRLAEIELAKVFEEIGVLMRRNVDDAVMRWR